MAMTLLDIEMMSSAEFRKKLDTDPSFKAEVEALYSNPTAAATGVVTSETEVPVEVTDAVPVPVVEPEPAPVVVEPTPVELAEQRYEYQPSDEQGRPIGGRQVLKYRTADELRDKLTEQNTLLIRQLRKVNREKVLGIEDSVPSDAEKFEKVVEFKPRDLSPSEWFEVAQKLQDPERFAEGRDQLLESALGVKPAALAQTLNELQQANIQQKAVENYIDFVNSTGTYDSPANREVLTGWMRKNGLRPTVANFNLALSRCRESGLIQDAPAVRQEPVPTPAPVVEQVVPVETVANAQPPVVEPTRISSEPQPQPKRHSHVPSGLNASVASAAGPVSSTVSVEGYSMTLADIDKIPADEYKRLHRDPKFSAYVNRLEAEAAAKRRARELGQV
jgi:hypothetical protein